MDLKGNYSALISYSAGDVVVWTDGTPYILNKTCKAGTPPTDSLYWERLDQALAKAVDLIMDGVAMAKDGALTGKVANNLTTTASGKVLDARQGKALKDLVDVVSVQMDMVYPNSKTLRLLSSTASSEKIFDITVDDDGELTATEYTPAAAT